MDADRRLFDFSEFWLISAPGERTCQQTWDVMNSVTSKQANLSTNFKFHIPDLKVFSVVLIDALSVRTVSVRTSDIFNHIIILAV